MIVKPTPQQAAWADLEFGLLMHADLQVFDETYTHDVQRREMRDPATFAPMELDTDQWCREAAEAGAKYFVLVAKHCSGFCLWPTKVHDYCIRSSPWKYGKGDVVGDFFASCEKYGLKPGLYYSVSRNGYYKVDNGRPEPGSPVTQEEYNDVVMRQLTELWTWYGPVFEIWFDGGVLPVSEGGPDVAGLMHRLQPDAVVFQGPAGTRSLLRWVGNENAMPDADCAATVHGTYEFFHGGRAELGSGHPDGDLWSPAESDMPARDASRAFLGGWFWRDGDDRYVFDKNALFDHYIGAVGRNSNLLLGSVMDNHGLIPRRDCEALEGLGKMIRTAFSEQRRIPADGLTVTVPSGRVADYIVIAEDVTEGERVRGFELLRDGEVFASGSVIGHKRIIPTGGLKGGVYTLRITAAAAEPILRDFAAY